MKSDTCNTISTEFSRAASPAHPSPMATPWVKEKVQKTPALKGQVKKGLAEMAKLPFQGAKRQFAY